MKLRLLLLIFALWTSLGAASRAVAEQLGPAEQPEQAEQTEQAEQAEQPGNAAGTSQDTHQDLTPGMPGSPLPAFSLINDYRRRVPSSEFLGKVVLLDFWATWCLPCRYTLPELQKLHERFADNDLLVFGLSIDRGARGGFAARRFADSLGITYPIFHDVTQDRASRALGVRSIPDLVLVDAQGIIRQRWIGEPDFSEVTAAVETLLKAPGKK